MKIIIKKIIVPALLTTVKRSLSSEDLKTRSKITLTIKDLPGITMGKLIRLYHAIDNVKRIMSGIPHAMSISINKPDNTYLSSYPIFVDSMDEKIQVNINDLPDLSDRELGRLHSAIGKLKAIIEKL